MNAPCCDGGGYATSTDWPSDVSELLFEQLEQLGFAGVSMLEIGCGYGRMLVGALLGGATQATGVELDPDALEEARKRADGAGVGERCELLEGDGAELELPPHDLVVVDRVVCCYPAGERLVEHLAALTGTTFAMSVPESRGLRGVWNRLTYPLGNLLDRLRGKDPVYLHDVRRIEARLLATGFRLHRGEWVGKWYVGIYQRPAAP
ncbi:MAG: class I SAM-dependent methyltransferase [Chloroflexota bacterium]|nr:class I SAM-dependent methyltransferase [Chloroflexota bacterium]